MEVIMRKFLAALLIVASVGATTAPTASALCYKKYFRDGTYIIECR